MREVEYLCICSLGKYKFIWFIKKKKSGLGFFGSVNALEETWCHLQNYQKDLGRSEVVIEL